MKKLVIIILIFITGCASKKLSDNFLAAERYYENYIKYYNTGDLKLAELNFLKSVDLFQKSDDICNLARIYIGKYILEDDNQSLDYAKRYSIMGKCDNEINSIDYLTGQKYSYDKLPESLKIQARTFKNADEIIRLLSKSKIPDYSKSRLYRDFSRRFLNNGLLNEADKLIDFAIEIDRFNGWTFNIKSDLILKKEICKNRNDECKYIDERLDIISNKLIRK